MPPLLPSKYKNPEKLLKDFNTRPENGFIRDGEKMALRLFHEMAKRVPAYKDFLKKNHINHKKIKNFKDFKNIPLISKDSYLKKYPLERLCWDGKFKESQWDISSTSGSTGEPFYFPRTDLQNEQYAASAELYLRNNFEIHKKSTLYINCFALGVWIGGIFTYEAIKTVSRHGNYKLTLINPGLNKIEILKTVKNLGPKFDQVILGGYPPFIKDVIDDGIKYGIRWKKYNIGIIFSAEGFCENFRNYIIKKTGIKNIYTGTLNHYGTVDQGTIAHETPLAILIRRMAVERPKLFNLVFREGISRLPTLAQYDPEMFFFEEINGGVVCSAYSGLPLVRYDLKDNGGVFTFEEIKKKFNDFGIDLMKEARKTGISDKIWHLPFVYVYERRDMSVSLSGANVYAENIKRALQNKLLYKFLTGKLSMNIRFNKNQDQYLEINLELKNGIKPNKNIKNLALNLIVKNLLKENSEYRAVYAFSKTRNTPKIILRPYEHPDYFRVGGKQKWVKK